MTKTLALLFALAGCLDQVELDQSEQALDGSARVRMLSLSSGGEVNTSAQTAPNSSTFTAYENLGQPQSPSVPLVQLATERNLDGRLSLFAIGGDDTAALYGRYQATPGGAWNPEGWQSMGGAWIKQVVTARDLDGRIEVFVRNTLGNVFHRFQVVPNGGWNPDGWLPLGAHDILSLAAATRADGRIELVAIGGDNHAYHRVQAAPNGGFDGDWSLLGGSGLTSVAFIRDVHGMQMFSLDTSHNVQNASEDGTGAWSGFAPIGHALMSQLVVGTTSDGRLDLLGITSGGFAYELMQAQITYTWPPFFTSLGWSGVTELALANEANGSQLGFVRMTDSTVKLATESVAGSGTAVWGSSLIPFSPKPQHGLVARDQQ